MQTLINDDPFFQVSWDESTNVIGIQWKETTSSMTISNRNFSCS